MTSTESYYGFIYTVFGLGASHMGLARARGKSLPGPAHGLEPAAQQLRPLAESNNLRTATAQRSGRELSGWCHFVCW